MTTMIHPLMSAVSIDKLTAIRTVDALPFIKTVAGMVINETKDTESGTIQTRRKGAYGICVKVYPPGEDGGYDYKEHALYLQINIQSGQIRIEYNPSKMSEEIYEHLNIFCITIMGQNFFEFLAGSYVTRRDLNVHIFGHSPEDFLFKFKKFRTGGIWFGQSKHIETIYAGRRKNNHFIVYDKAKQLNGSKYEGSCLRIEAVVREKIPMSQLPDTQNPFERVVLYGLEPEKYPKGIHPSHWQGFADSARLRGGVKGALARQRKDVRGKFAYALSKLPVEWWKPEIFWAEQWYETLEECHLLNLPPVQPLTLKAMTGEDDVVYKKAS